MKDPFNFMINSVKQVRSQIHFLLLVSILLLIGQLGIISHSVDHPFHAQDESCQLFLQCEKLGDSAVSLELQELLVLSETLATIPRINTFLSAPSSGFLARAPPYLL